MALYYFIDAAGERKLIGSSNFRLTGAWSGSTSYQPRDVATDGSGHYWMALIANTNVAIPSTFDTSVPTTWTHLVQAETSPLSPEDQAIATANEAMALSTAALTTAWVGTATANVAGTLAAQSYSTSYAALATAWTGTALANEAYGLATYAISLAGTAAGGGSADAYNLGRTALDTAWYGTSSAAEAQATATAALTTSWVGTAAASGAQSQADAALAVATAALTTAWAGTDAPTAQAEAAYSLGLAALDTAWVGTSTGHEAYDLARSAYDLAASGTGSPKGPASSTALSITRWQDATSGTLSNSTVTLDNYGALVVPNPTTPFEQLWAGWTGNVYRIHSQVTRPGSDRDLEIAVSGSGNIAFKTGATTRWSMTSSGDWVPGATNSYNLGSNSNQARQLHVAGAVYFYGGLIGLGSPDTYITRDEIGKAGVRSIASGGPKHEWRIGDEYNNAGNYSRLSIGSRVGVFNGTAHFFMSEATPLGAFAVKPIVLCATGTLNDQLRLNTDASIGMMGPVNITTGTLGVKTQWNDVNRTYTALDINITNAASSNTSAAVIVTTGNQEVFRVNKAGGVIVSGSYGVIGSASLGIGMESAGAYFQGFGGQPLFFQPLGNKIGLCAGAAAPANFVEIGKSWGLAGTQIVYDSILTDVQNVVLANAATYGGILITLPPAATAVNRIYTIKKVDNTGNPVTIRTSDEATQRIDGDWQIEITSPYQMYRIISNSGTWWTV